MENSKLVRLLKTIGKDEFRELEKFTASPYFTSGRDCTPLLRALKSCYPEFTGEKITKREVYNRIYTGKDYGDKKSESLLSTLSSELYKLTLEFLTYSQFKKDNRAKNLMLLRNFIDKNLHKEFDAEYKNAVSDDNLNENSDRRGSAANFLESHRLQYMYNEYAWRRSDMHGLYNGLLASTDAAISFALITAYKFMDTKDTASYTFNIETGETYSDILLDALDNEKMLAGLSEHYPEIYPYIHANYLVYKMNRRKGQADDESLQYFHKLKEMFAENYDKFGHREKYMLGQAMENFLTIRLDAKNDDYGYSELFSLYNQSLVLDTYKISPEHDFEPTVFRNMVFTACDVKEYEWAEKFIAEYSAELPKEFAAGITDHAYSTVYFNKGEYEKALKHISRIKYDYPRHKVDAKVLQFKIYYELGEFEPAYNILDTLRHAVKDEATPSNFKRRVTGFIKYAGELLKLKTNDTAMRDGRQYELKAKLKEGQPVEANGWLIKKFEEIPQS